MTRPTHHYRRGLQRKGLLLGSVALLAMGVLAQSVHGASGDKVLVCHSDPDTGIATVLTLPPTAVDAHLSHGDSLVGPEDCTDTRDNDCNGLTDLEDPACEAECQTACDAAFGACRAACEAQYAIRTPEFDACLRACAADWGDCLRRCEIGR